MATMPRITNHGHADVNLDKHSLEGLERDLVAGIDLRTNVSCKPNVGGALKGWGREGRGKTRTTRHGSPGWCGVAITTGQQAS